MNIPTVFIGTILFVCQPTNLYSQHTNSSRALADSLNLIDKDYNRLIELNDYVSEWNYTAAPLVRDYLDPGVQGDVWVKNAKNQISDLRTIYMNIKSAVIAVHNTELREFLLEIDNNYRAKLDAITSLMNAVSKGDSEGEQQAQLAIHAAATRGNELALIFLDKIRPTIDPDKLAAEMKRRGKIMSDLLKPR